MTAVMLTGQLWPAVKLQEPCGEERVTAGTCFVGGGREQALVRQ